MRKNQELIRALQDKDRNIHDMEEEKNEEVNKLRQDNNEMHQQINHLNYLLGKVKSELTEKDNLIGRSITETEGEIQMLRKQMEVKKQENLELASNLREERARNK